MLRVSSFRSINSFIIVGVIGKFEHIITQCSVEVPFENFPCCLLVTDLLLLWLQVPKIITLLTFACFEKSLKKNFNQRNL